MTNIENLGEQMRSDDTFHEDEGSDVESTEDFIKSVEREIADSDDPLVKAALQDQIDQLKEMKGKNI
jgi:hypothetical protein